jgi:radical SAM superfamily enzyme YgiQ (UPF0313 family)
MPAGSRKCILLIDLPTFPKGVISLSLLTVASCLSEDYDVSIDDLNIIGYNDYELSIPNAVMYGLKVSSQNVKQAISLSKKIKAAFPDSKLIWGGELPSLLPDFCLQYADTVVGGLFESIAEPFIADLKSGKLQSKYFGENNSTVIARPDFNALPHRDRYYQFMGYPLETSRGCTEKCIFCMVHTMQKKNYNLSAIDFLKTTIDQYRGKFINIVDYNFGVSPSHVIETSALIRESGATGWMAEMCIELLDNDEMLAAMRDSRCKMIYCGLESIDQQSLNSVHKMNTNHIENYERIIRKVQSYGIQIAAGIILGLEGTHTNTFKELFDFYQRMGIIYGKLTFLTYNPGTKVHEYEKKRGVFLNENLESYDGNQLTFLPNGVDQKYVINGAEWFVKKYYSLSGIISRSFNTKLSFSARLEYILFNICYRQVYLDWIRYDTLHHPENINIPLELPFRKPGFLKVAEKMLDWLRKNQIKR